MKISNNVKILSVVVFMAVVVAVGLLQADTIVSGRPLQQSRYGPYSMVGAASLLALTNTTHTSTNSAPVAIDNGVDLAFWISASAASASTSNVVYGFDTSPDGLTWSTTLPITATLTLNGTTGVVQYVFISKTNLVGVGFIRWDSSSTPSLAAVTLAPPLYTWLLP